MARYIDADRLLMNFKTNGSVFVYGLSTVNAIISRINVQPTADVVEVVRCKDCKNHEWCSIEEAALYDKTFFCKKGERREDG